MVKREFTMLQRGEIVVARIMIEPHVVIVEYEHPIIGRDPADDAAP